MNTIYRFFINIVSFVLIHKLRHHLVPPPPPPCSSSVILWRNPPRGGFRWRNISIAPYLVQNDTLQRLFWNQNHLLKVSKSPGGDFGNPKLPGVILKVFDRFFKFFFFNLSFCYLRLYYNSIFILTAVQHNNVVVRYNWIVLVLYFYCRILLKIYQKQRSVLS